MWRYGPPFERLLKSGPSRLASQGAGLVFLLLIILNIVQNVLGSIRKEIADPVYIVVPSPRRVAVTLVVVRHIRFINA